MSILMYNVSINIEKGYIMKKIIVICLVLWFGLNAFAKSVQADDYNTAVVAHVIKENISGNGVDMSVLEAEMAKLAYKFSLEMMYLRYHLHMISIWCIGRIFNQTLVGKQ